MNLYEQLMHGEVEYRDDGIMIRHNPTATAMRAARHIKLLEEGSNNLSQTLMQAQAHVEQLLHEQEQFKNEQNRLYNDILQAEAGRDTALAELKGILHGEGQAGNVSGSDGRAILSYPAG